MNLLLQSELSSLADRTISPASVILDWKQLLSFPRLYLIRCSLASGKHRSVHGFAKITIRQLFCCSTLQFTPSRLISISSWLPFLFFFFSSWSSLLQLAAVAMDFMHHMGTTSNTIHAVQILSFHAVYVNLHTCTSPTVDYHAICIPFQKSKYIPIGRSHQCRNT